MKSKKMIDNIELYKKYILKFEKPGDFFYCNILLRKKDLYIDKGNHQSVRVIKDYCFYSIEELEARYDEIKLLSEVFAARVYMGVNLLNDAKVSFGMMKELLSRMESGNNNNRNLWASVVGSLKAQGDKKWLVDIDAEELTLLEEIKTHINELEPIGDKIICQIPSKSGIHIITKPFRLEHFIYKCDVQKLNPSILYVPDSLLIK